MQNGKPFIYISILGILLGLSATIGPRFYKKYFISHGFVINKLKYPVMGIDVSKHTGKIDWQRIKAHDLDFVFIKASEGADYEDPNFKKNFEGAKTAQLKAGAYHFYRFNKDGISQAKNFLHKIENLNLDFAPVLDVEEWGNSNSLNKSAAQIIKEISDFVEMVENKTGKKVIIYTNESAYSKFIKGHFDGNLLWICTFKKPGKDMKWTFWQYSHKGKLSGAEGLLDINTFNGSRKEWERFAAGNGN